MTFLKNRYKHRFSAILALAWVFTCLTLPAASRGEEVTQRHGNLTLNANLEIADGNSLEDGVVLVLHGMLAHNKMELVENTQRALLENGWNSLAINLSLGIDNRHGFFDCGWPHRHLQEDAIDEVAAWVEWLRRQGVDRVVLLAHSRGANQAMVYAVQRKDPEVTHLVFLAPGTVDDSKTGYEGRYGPVFDDTLERAKQLIKTGRGDAPLENANLFFCPQVDISAASFLSYYDTASPFHKFQSYLPQITVPTLITTGTMDERSPNIEENVTPYVDGELIRLNVIEGADHFFRDFNIDEAMEAVVEFLEQAD